MFTDEERKFHDGHAPRGSIDGSGLGCPICEVNRLQGFTDDKLRIYRNVMLSQTAPIYVSHSELEALLARLEAGEKALEKHTVYSHDCDEMKAWRKAAGK